MVDERGCCAVSADVATMREMAERAGFQVTGEVKMAYLVAVTACVSGVAHLIWRRNGWKSCAS